MLHVMTFVQKKLTPFILISLALIVYQAEAQSLKEHLQKGDRFYQRKDYENALKNYLEALALDKDHAQANFKTGISYLNEEAYSQAVIHLEKAYELKPELDARIDYHLAMAYQEDHKFDKARKHFEAFKAKYKNLAAIANQKITECILADSLMRIPLNATVRPLDEINSSFAEFSPLLSPDGKMLIFTSNRSADDYQIKSATNFEDVYISEYTGGQWGHPQKISPNINVKPNEAAMSLSPDGKTLFLYYEEGRGDIYTSTKENGIWSTPVPLNQFVNHPHYRESGACLSADGKKLFFSSNRPGGKGGYDIYVCELSSKGDWGRPSNLGSAINTRADEEFPFLDADGVTMYFSSNGHPAIGNYDIFKSTFESGNWTSPANLGYPINTRAYEGNLILSRDGKTGYFSSRRVSTPGNMDIYTVLFSSSGLVTRDPTPKGRATATGKRNNIITVLKGTVIDVSNAAPLEATIRLVDNANRIVVSTIKTGPSGNFELKIPHAGNFGVTTEKPGYLFNSMNFNLAPFDKYQQVDTHILMVKAVVGSKVVLKNIFFDVNQSDLKPESRSELENIRDLLIQNPEWRVQINGHTDNVGHSKTNLALSLKRAESVVQYLIQAGISPDRLQAKGYGSEKPLVSNDDEEEGRQINRRTEIEIIE
jgi:outer membrane protein OmpA-like peptidoglycan-associated protein/Tol biopolymer transport system component